MNATRGEVSTVVVLSIFAVLIAAAFVTTTLNQEPKNTQSQAAATNCPYDSGVELPLGQTETNASNAEPRVPISSNRYYYDSLKDIESLTSISDEGVLTLSKSDSGPVDQAVVGMMGSMFGYKPSRILGAYTLPQESGGAYVLAIPTNPHQTNIAMPATGYDIGGGYEAMVVFAEADRVTLHIGRHEYFTGTKTCANGKTCSGGYWIYVKGICVDQQIISAYNKVKSAQQAAGADLNPIQLPMVRPGHILGKASGEQIYVGVRDNGPFISIHKPDYWRGVSDFAYTPQNPANNNNNNSSPHTPIPTSHSCGKIGERCCNPNDGQYINQSCQNNGVCAQGICAQPTPTTKPKPVCNAPRILCPGTDVCVPALVECEGVPTKAPTPTLTHTPTPGRQNINQGTLTPAQAQANTITTSSQVFLPACTGSDLTSAAQGIRVEDTQECIIISP